MSGVIGNLPTFDHEAQEWRIYHERLDQWFCANDITEAGDKSGVRRKAILLSALTESSYKLIRDLVHPKEITTCTYQQTIEALNTHFSPRKCVIAERHRFYCAVKNVDEGLKEWAARVRSLAAHCKFPSLDETLRDRFVLGMQSGPARDRLFTEEAGTLTLAKAIDIAESICSAREASQATSVATTSVFMGSELPQVNRVEFLKKSKCSVCGYKNHSERQCKFANYVCRKCNVKGHLSKMCSSNNNKKSSVPHHYLDKASDDDDGEFLYLNNISTLHGEAMMQNINVNGIYISFEVDSGSYVSTISKQLYLKYFSNLTLKPNKLILKVYTGAELHPLGVISLPVTYEGQKEVLEFHVIDNECPPLLGRNFLSIFNMQICKVNYCQADSLNVIIKQIHTKYSQVFQDKLGCFNQYSVSLTLKSEVKPFFLKHDLCLSLFETKLKWRLIDLLVKEY